MKVYIIHSCYDNGNPYEDHYSYDRIDAVFATKETALEYVNSLSVPDGWNEGYPEGEEKLGDELRHFYHVGKWGTETRWYTISEHEVR